MPRRVGKNVLFYVLSLNQVKNGQLPFCVQVRGETERETSGLNYNILESEPENALRLIMCHPKQELISNHKHVREMGHGFRRSAS